ncbi:MAG: peptide deformylase [Anaerolineae bacterium]|nr:peptide deformylase [Caldilineales bacterium]MCX7852175.1 peptide deformylase [Caldilineales bacterium]MDW8267542.1 peptide deformylase [Anaerolineae bacterium]
MTVLDIIKLGDPRLRKKSVPVRRFDERLSRLAHDMVETMRQSQGVGLAAPQVGVNERLIVVEMRKEDFEDDPQAGKLYVVVNPEIVRVRGDKIAGDEGCLSIPGYVGEVERPQHVTVRGYDLRGRPVQIKAYNFLARVFLHEIDHLDGVLFLDRISDISKLRRLVRDPQSDEIIEEPVTTIPIKL